MATQITEYSKTDAALADLANRFKGVVFEVATKEGMSAALKARAEVRGYRLDLEKVRVEIKAPALERCRLIDAEAARIRKELESLEDPIDEQIKLEETRKDRERAEREAKEAERIKRVQDAIAEINAEPAGMVGKPAAEIEKALERMLAYVVGEWAYEFKEQAAEAQARAIAALEQLHAGALAQEKAAAEEAARVKAEREELARLRAEQEQRAREEQARIAEETRKRAEAEAAARAKIEAEERASREKIEAEERAARLAREEEDRKARAVRAAEAERQAAEDARLREEREKIEAERREIERQAAELLDGRAMLATFVKKFGRRKEFAPVVKAIDAFLQSERAPA